MKADFSGYATKAGLKCSDGRTIMPEAFKHMDGMTVPLVWQHGHSEPANILGHAVLEARDDGVYAYGFFNDTPSAENAKTLVSHKDIKSLSIYANQLVERTKQVFHGVIREVSLVLSGANPGALIDNVAIAHSDGSTDVLDDEAIIFTGLELEHADGPAVKTAVVEPPKPPVNKSEDDTAQAVYDSLTEEQKQLVHYMVGTALDAAANSQSATHQEEEKDADGNIIHKDADGNIIKEGNSNVTRNVFEQTGVVDDKRPTLTHSQLQIIVEDAKKLGSFKDSLLAHAEEYGIGNIDLLFPDAKAVTSSPDFVKRRTEWVAGVIDGTKHSPFSRIKSLFADITADEARAKGYLKGNKKKEEFFALSKRTTAPCTIYKKQKLDRDDILDITDLDVVSWLKAEMRIMLDEEIAGAVLVGDGRAVDDPDKVLDPAGASSGPGMRSIANDDEFYAYKATYNSAAGGWKPDAFIDTVVNALSQYEGSGSPTLYTTTFLMNSILLQKDTLGRRLYANRAEVASLMGVSNIIDVPDSVMARAANVKGIVVNLQDYVIGTDQGGEVNMFDNFDIDYNQYRYLMEGRSSGALVKYRSAIILIDTTTAVTPVVIVTAPSFVDSTGVVTIPTETGVVYSQDGVVVAAGAQTAVAAGVTTIVDAAPATGYEFNSGITTEWEFTRNPA